MRRPIRRATTIVLLAAVALAVAVDPAAVPGAEMGPALRRCVVQGLEARCGSLAVPEDRRRPGGRRVLLRVVVLSSRARRPARDAFTYLAGGPGGAASESTAAAASIWDAVRAKRDIVLVDQRGTGGSKPLECPLPDRAIETDEERRAYVDACLASLDADLTQYGTVQAADDLEAVRRALGYRTLDVYGTSYGATVAQVFHNRHPRSVRTMVLDGGTLLDIPFYERFARNGAAALEQIRRRCAADPACARAFPRWRENLTRLIARWNETPVEVTPAVTYGGDGLAGLVQAMTLDAARAASIPLAVTRAAAGDVRILARFVNDPGAPRAVMFWSIMCNEPWVGRDARGPWGTYLDGSAQASLDLLAEVCPLIPSWTSNASDWRRPAGRTPVLALVGGADPQDPVGNLAGLATSMPRARVVVVPGQGHAIGQLGCLGRLVARFVDRGTAAGLDVGCARRIPVPSFTLR
jgi:pimeloyl-ACP methyl ester carboxylesterase